MAGRRGWLKAGEDPDPRFSFANERTFLAWIRTALGMVAGGLAVVQLLPPFKFPGGRHLLGLILIGLGAFAAATSYVRWARAERALRAHEPLPSSGPLLVVALVIVALATIAGALIAFATK